MGLDMTHDAWHGSYGSFHRFRVDLAIAAGIDLERMRGFKEGEGLPWPDKKTEPLVVLLNHSDCDGDIDVEDLIPLANRLVTLLPNLNEWARDRAQQLILGCHWAASENEPIEFQ